MSSDRIAYTVREAARSVGMTELDIYKAIHSGRLPAADIRRPGSMNPRYRILRDDMIEWLKSLRVDVPQSTPAVRAVGSEYDPNPWGRARRGRRAAR